MRSILFALVLLMLVWAALIPAPPPSTAQGAQGISSGRATDADVARLIGDLNQIAIAENRTRLANTKTVLAARQAALLGLEDKGEPLAELLKKAEDWWIKNILETALDVSSNPAASCELSEETIVRILTIERQRQFLGLDDSAFAGFGNPDSVLNKALTVIKQRCLEEAFDECMQTGNGHALGLLMVGSERQAQMLGGEDPKFHRQAAYLFRRCTVYKVKFTTESHVNASNYVTSASGNGSLNLLADLPRLDQPSTVVEWKGPTPAEATAPDIMVTNISCKSFVGSSMECGKDATPNNPFIGFAQVELKRYFNEVTVSNGQRQVTRKEMGDNKLTLTRFLMPAMFTRVTWGGAGSGPIEVLAGAFISVHSNTGGLVTISDWERVGYPVLFRKEIQGTKPVKRITYTNKTTFEFIHRPDLFPPDQIDPELELKPSTQPDPRRTPARPIRP